MGARRTVIVVGACMIGLAVGCGGERSSPEPDVRAEPSSVVDGVEAPPSGDEGTASDRRILGGGCWAADVELPAGECRSAHLHIADALSSCSAKGGEAIAVDVTQACDIGFRGAAITCCPAGARVTAPPAALPEPIAADPTVTSVGECSTSSAVMTEVADCARETSLTEAVAELVASHAASGEEVRSYRFFARCKDGGFAGFASSSCTPGYRRE